MLLLSSLLCFCSLVCFVVVHEFVFGNAVVSCFLLLFFLFINLCCCSLVCFVVVHEFVFTNVVVHYFVL